MIYRNTPTQQSLKLYIEANISNKACPIFPVETLWQVEFSSKELNSTKNSFLLQIFSFSQHSTFAQWHLYFSYSGVSFLFIFLSLATLGEGGVNRCIGSLPFSSQIDIINDLQSIQESFYRLEAIGIGCWQFEVKGSGARVWWLNVARLGLWCFNCEWINRGKWYLKEIINFLLHVQCLRYS